MTLGELLSKLSDLLKSKSTQKRKFEKQTMFFFWLHIAFFFIYSILFKTGTLSWEACKWQFKYPQRKRKNKWKSIFAIPIT